MNYIGLDISKISTALVIETNGVEHIFSYNTQKSDAKWNENIKGIATIRTYEYDNVEGDYSKSEINKLQQFSKISGDILCDINDTIDNFDEIVLYLEGYSYGKNAGPLIDLVGIGSIIRTKIYEDISNIKEIKIIAPKSLKLMTAELVYGSKMVEIGKRVKRTEKVINPNNDGVSGGSFDLGVRL